MSVSAYQKLRPQYRMMGQHEERLGQGQRLALQRDLSLLHGLQQRGLRLGRGAVDLVRQYDVGKDRTAAQFELILGAVEDVAARDVAWQQVGRELDALEVQPQDRRKTARDERLAQARVILEQHVPARQRRRHDHVEHVALADHGALHFVDNLPAQIGYGFDVCHGYSI